MEALQHTTVLLDEAVDALRVQPDGVYVDATFGRGGHARAMAVRLSAAGRLWVFDKDPEAIAVAQEFAATRPVGQVRVVHDSFAHLGQSLGEQCVDGVLLDLGVSSPQLDAAERGFSFRHDGPLDMRMDNTRGSSAAEWVNTASVQELAKVIRDYGEERFAVPVAKAIVARRAVAPFERTRDLAQVVAGAVKTREPGQDPATRTFQALRIYVNQELEELPLTLEQAMQHLNPGGRLAVISFHSLEDRIVKQFMQAHSKLPQALSRLPLRESELPALDLAEVSRILPGADEIARNPRARSAVLRCATRTRGRA
jgi:16S rRNA (cytosine1402-N4)-methyltransferase